MGSDDTVKSSSRRTWKFESSCSNSSALWEEDGKLYDEIRIILSFTGIGD